MKIKNNIDALLYGNQINENIDKCIVFNKLEKF